MKPHNYHMGRGGRYGLLFTAADHEPLEKSAHFPNTLAHYSVVI